MNPELCPGARGSILLQDADGVASYNLNMWDGVES
jgi:hypothetical protein